MIEEDTESLAYTCVEYITQFIDLLRSIPEFNVVEHQKAIIRNERQGKQSQQPQSKVNDDSNHHDSKFSQMPLLYTRMKETTELVQKVEEIYNQSIRIDTEQEQQQHNKYKCTNWSIPSCNYTAHCTRVHDVKNSDTVQQLHLERSLLVYNIVLPLLATLGKCYEILDQVVPSQQLQNNDIDDNNNSNKNNTATTSSTIHSINGNTKSISKKNKPIPPIGMLSLQHYTNIACCIEFLICTSIVPFICISNSSSNNSARASTNQIENQQSQHCHTILTSLHDRIRYELPKSLSGRIPSLSLQWASSIASSSTNSGTPAFMSAIQKYIHTIEWESVICVLGRLLLLDRFRPMLLPRHCTDIIAIILYRQEFYKTNLKNQNILALIVDGWIGTPQVSHDIIDKFYHVDSYWRVKSYQKLLRYGRAKTPLWLRQRLAQLLSNIATYDLIILITIFVHEAIDQDYTAASLRLAQALVSKDMTSMDLSPKNLSNNNEYFIAICDQLIAVLDLWIFPSGTTVGSEHNNGKSNVTTIHRVASIGTIWSVLDLLPESIVFGYFFNTIVREDIATTTICPNQDGNEHYVSNIHRIIRRFITLLLNLPNNVLCVTKICHLFFKSFAIPQILDGGCQSKTNELSGLSLLALIIRLASSPTIVKSYIHDDVVMLLQLFIQTMETNTKFNDDSEVTGIDVLVVALISSLAPCSWDSESCCFDFSFVEKQDERSYFRPLPLHRPCLKHDDINTKFNVNGIEERLAFLTRFLLGVNTDIDAETSNQVMPVFFHTLLQIYLTPKPNDTNSDFPIFQNDMFILVSMVSLPYICENSPPDKLLSFDTDDGIFDVMATVIHSAASQYEVVEHEGKPDSHSLSLMDSKACQRCLRSTVNIVLGQDHPEATVTMVQERFDRSDDEMIFSLTSTILGLLVSILELGAQRRTIEIETKLQTFVPDLLILANTTSTTLSNGNHDLLSRQTQIAEMASFAGAQIASRNYLTIKSTTDSNNEIDGISFGFIENVENDLMSELPPIRARAMVLLRNHINSISHQSKSGDENYENDADRILLVSMKALKDSESYVYLAAIHTIVAVAGTNPSKFIPILGIAVATGYFDDNQGIKYEVNHEQRTKLNEALVFIVRRGGDFYHTLPFLIDLLVMGLKYEEQAYTVEETKLIHDLTHRYFISGTNDEESEMQGTLNDYWRELDVRVRTGGPLFQTENRDIVRAAMVNVVCELVTVLSPSVTARYCPTLVACCIDTLRLETARPVRRAGGALARDLYAALVREMDALLDATANRRAVDVPLCVAMITGREEVLFCVLQHIVNGSGLHIKFNFSDGLRDPAVIARCEEAIALRKLADDGGIIIAGKVALEAKRRQDMNPISRLLSMTNSGNNQTASLKNKFIIEEM